MQDGPNFVVVAGLSGAGRSTVADTLEDLGWFVIDNPSSLLSSVELLTAADPRVQRLALVAGSHQHQEDLLDFLAGLNTSPARVSVRPLGCAHRCASASLRPNTAATPLQPTASPWLKRSNGNGVLDPIKQKVDLVIDTGDLIVRELKSRVVEAFSEAGRNQLMQTTAVVWV